MARRSAGVERMHVPECCEGWVVPANTLCSMCRWMGDLGDTREEVVKRLLAQNN
jgi:hypothetical protein